MDYSDTNSFLFQFMGDEIRCIHTDLCVGLGVYILLIDFLYISTVNPYFSLLIFGCVCSRETLLGGFSFSGGVSNGSPFFTYRPPNGIPMALPTTVNKDEL